MVRRMCFDAREMIVELQSDEARQMLKAAVLCGTTSQQIGDKYAAVSWVANCAKRMVVVLSGAHERNGRHFDECIQIGIAMGAT
jgi:hypothetical protein